MFQLFYFSPFLQIFFIKSKKMLVTAKEILVWVRFFIFYTVTNMAFLENRHLNKELEFLTIIISHLLQLSILSKCFDFLLKNFF